MSIALIVVIAVIVLALIGAGVYLVDFLRNKEASDLNRYLGRDDCPWERNAPESQVGAGDRIYFVNHAPEPQGIEMRVYYYSEPADGSMGDNDGYCLSIIDQGNRNGMILNGFVRPLEAMEFGDGLWNDRFLGDAGIMEETISEKRTAWDQMQQDIIIANYHMFM